MKKIIMSIIVGFLSLYVADLYAANGELLVNGLRVNGQDTSVNQIWQGNAGTTLGITANGGKISFGQTSTQHMVLTSGGTVGIGITAPASKLDVAGIVRATGFSQISARKFKSNILPVSSSLDKVMTMQGVTYNWKSNEYTELNFPTGTHYGVIAEDMEKVLPEAVMTAQDGTKSVAYIEIIPVLIEAIKEQQKEIEALKQMIDK